MLVFVGGTVRTCVGPGTIAESIAIDHGRIVAIGRRDIVVAQAGAGAEMIDLRGQTLVPGFIDAHHHLSLHVLLDGGVDCSPSVAPDLATLLARLRAEAATLPAGAWVVGRGYSDLQLRERRHPSREELDASCPEHPVFLYHYSCHEGVGNSRALELAGLGPSAVDPPAGRIERDRRGRVTGRLIETALCPVERLARADRLVRDRGIVDRLVRQQGELFATGITRICDPTVPSDVMAILRAARAGADFVLPVVMMPVSDTGYLVPPWDALEAMRPGDGPEDLRVGPLKVFSDGANNCALCIRPLQLVHAFASTLAHMISRRTLAPLRLARQTKFRYERGRLRAGIPFFTPPQLRELAQRATERGVELAVHANGNDAVGIVTDALAGVGGSHRIEHCTFMTLDQCARIADANLTAVVQPMFLQLPAFDDVPPLPGVTTIPIRSLLDAGVRVAGSSDAPVSSFDVLAAMRAATRRKTLRGYAICPEQAVSAEEVLAMYTREAARACGCLDVTGTLESGKRADLVVLSADPCATGVELDAVRVKRTILAGKTVFTA